MGLCIKIYYVSRYSLYTLRVASNPARLTFASVYLQKTPDQHVNEHRKRHRTNTVAFSILIYCSTSTRPHQCSLLQV